MEVRFAIVFVSIIACGGIQTKETRKTDVRNGHIGVPFLNQMGFGFPSIFGSHHMKLFNGMIEQGLQHAKDPANAFLIAEHAKTYPVSTTHGYFISYATESRDGSKWHLDYDHGCEPKTHANKCFFRLGETVASDGTLWLNEELDENATIDMETHFNLYGLLQKVFGSIVHSPLAGRCPACGADCDRSQMPERLRNFVREVTIPVNPCPVPRGEIIFDRNVTEIPNDFASNSIHFDVTGTETLRRGDGKLIFRTTITIAMGPMSSDGSEGQGGSWVMYKPPATH